MNVKLHTQKSGFSHLTNSTSGRWHQKAGSYLADIYLALLWDSSVLKVEREPLPTSSGWWWLNVITPKTPLSVEAFHVERVSRPRRMQSIQEIFPLISLAYFVRYSLNSCLYFIRLT